jgi:two-component system, NtrC family, response regulator HydG
MGSTRTAQPEVEVLDVELKRAFFPQATLRKYRTWRRNGSFAQTAVGSRIIGPAVRSPTIRFGERIVMPHALLVDDSAATLDALAALVRGAGYTVSTAPTVERARSELRRQTPDVVMLDLMLPDGSGMSLLDALESIKAPAVVLITGHASVDTAIEALRRGVTDYLVKPIDIQRLRQILADIARTSQLPQEINELRAELSRTGRFGVIVGTSAATQGTCDLIARIAPSSASVLISGESGTGKDVVARTIHEFSRRRHNAFLPVNCGAISPTLMESELFGHERGSFTGADRRHKGYFERANHGTLFLDEITEMPTELQVKLLRVLETGTFLRVGGEDPVSVDVRVLAASNRNPLQAVEKGTLREDLYYRLKVFQLPLVPLRERPEDVEPLARYFLQEIEKSEGVRKDFTDGALRVLSQYAWPGNVRELRNVVQSACILAGLSIDVDSLPDEVSRGGTADPRPTDEGTVLRVIVGTPLADVERRLITATLAQCEGNKTKAAEVLGISLKTLYNRLHAYWHADQAQVSGVRTDDAVM